MIKQPRDFRKSKVVSATAKMPLQKSMLRNLVKEQRIVYCASFL